MLPYLQCAHKTKTPPQNFSKHQPRVHLTMIVRKTSHVIEIVVNVSTHAHSEQLVGSMLFAELSITIQDVSAQNVSLEDLI